MNLTLSIINMGLSDASTSKNIHAVDILKYDLREIRSGQEVVEIRAPTEIYGLFRFDGKLFKT